MMKERSYGLDVVRVLACFMVIVMHSPIPDPSQDSSLILACISYFTAPCIGLFFMVSGALLLPTRESTMSFISRRLGKIIYPTLFWTVFYIICNVVTGKLEGGEIIKSLLSIPFAAQGNSVLWFMYTMLGLYLLAPILSAWLDKNDEKTVMLYLGLWCITLFYPFLHLVLHIPSGEENVLFYFSGYAGYFLLGYYLNNYIKRITFSRKYIFLWIVGLGIIFIPPILCKINHWAVNIYSLFWYLSIGVALMCIGWFLLIHKISLFQNKNRITVIFADISKTSFGIYLIHIFIMRSVLWNLDVIKSLPYTVQIPICAMLTFGLSYLISKCISHFSFSKYIIGY